MASTLTTISVVISGLSDDDKAEVIRRIKQTLDFKTVVTTASTTVVTLTVT